MTKADSELIVWLLNSSELSISEISKGSGVAWTTVSDLKKEKTSIERMSLENAAKLTQFASEVKRNVD